MHARFLLVAASKLAQDDVLRRPFRLLNLTRREGLGTLFFACSSVSFFGLYTGAVYLRLSVSKTDKGLGRDRKKKREDCFIILNSTLKIYELKLLHFLY